MSAPAERRRAMIAVAWLGLVALAYYGGTLWHLIDHVRRWLSTR